MRPRVVLLGASNVALGLPAIVGAAWGVLGRPIDVFGALGHGRSYGASSSVLGRSLCGILQSGVWGALRAAPSAPTYALVTDVGNDVGYGAAPELVASWVEECLVRLEALGARTVLTLLPMESLAALGSFRYRAFRALLFPSCRLRLEEALERSRELDWRLREAAGRCGVATAAPDARWYGLDPIHIQRRLRKEAWGRVFASWGSEGEGEGARAREPVSRPERGGERSPVPSFEAVSVDVPLRLALRIRRLRPETWTILGRELGVPQPSAPLPDGTRFWLY